MVKRYIQIVGRTLVTDVVTRMVTAVVIAGGIQSSSSSRTSSVCSLSEGIDLCTLYGTGKVEVSEYTPVAVPSLLDRSR